MKTKLKKKDDVKIFILYLMRNVGYPMDFATLNDMVLQDEFVDYFSFAECFGELVDVGNIEQRGISDEGTKLYVITERGNTVAETLESNIMGYIRDRSLKSAMRMLNFKLRGSEIKCESTPREDGRYDLKCTIIEDRKTTMELNIVIDNPYTLERMKLNFDNRPEVVYRGILALLSGEMNYIIG
ncbi:MAG: DUF4364 family protein [Clostridia bacterium]|nr:DUF4364 family protein [Clostridia bacterium]MBQ4575300.1 DUF4364 family protein [Clostridia bacterium]